MQISDIGAPVAGIVIGSLLLVWGGVTAFSAYRQRPRNDVEAILAETHPESASQPPNLTAARPPQLSPGSTTTVGARLTGPEDSATTDTTEPRVDTPPVHPAPSPPVWRRNMPIVGMAVTAIILVAGRIIDALPNISLIIAASLIIAIGVVLVRRRDAFRAQRQASGR